MYQQVLCFTEDEESDLSNMLEHMKNGNASHAKLSLPGGSQYCLFPLIRVPGSSSPILFTHQHSPTPLSHCIRSYPPAGLQLGIKGFPFPLWLRTELASCCSLRHLVGPAFNQPIPKMLSKLGHDNKLQSKLTVRFCTGTCLSRPPRIRWFGYATSGSCCVPFLYRNPLVKHTFF